MDISEGQGPKRKRSPSEAIQVPSRSLSQPMLPNSNVTQINYLVKSRNDKMKLVEGDSETFDVVLGLIDEYEGVLQRHESLAANLGAKLVGPLLLKSFEKLFEGPIRVVAPYSPEGISVTWLDIVEFAKANQQDFCLSDSRNGSRVCQFWIKNCSVEISEDDYRLILSGAPERMIPTQPIVEDEVAELGTMDILEQRLSMLIKKADMIAGRARQLNYHLKGRKSAIQSRRANLQLPEQQSVTVQSPGNSESRTVHADLLRQFHSEERKSVPQRIKQTRTLTEPPSLHNGGSPTPQDPNGRTSHPHIMSDDGTGGQYRPLMTARVEKIARGDPVWPPCDRCRRLRMDCTKHLTACSGCTKKHAKCSWKDITEDEVPYIIQVPVSSAENEEREIEDSHANLDPGLRTNHGNGIELGGLNSDTGMFNHQGETTRHVNVSEEHNMLSQIAAAAAADSQ